MKLKRPKSDADTELQLPARSDVVTIVRPSGERAQARVAECDGESLLVALMFRTERPFEAGRLDGLVLEFTDRRGRIRLQGTVTLEDRELLRFRELHSMEVIQEREYVRVPATRPVAVTSASSRSSIQTFSVDLSGGGMLLAGPGTLKVGERIQFRLTHRPGRLADHGHRHRRAHRQPGPPRRLLRRDRRGRPPSPRALHLRVPARRTAPRAGPQGASWPLRTRARARPRTRRPTRRARRTQVRREVRRRAERRASASPRTRAPCAASPRPSPGAALVGFLLGGYLSLPTHSAFEAALRALVAGVVCYVVVWTAAVFLWRRLVVAELRHAQHELLAAELAKLRERRSQRDNRPPAGSAAGRR